MVSNYDELLLIKKELQSNIKVQEESFKNDILFTGNIIKIFKISFSKKKNKKKRRFLNNSLILILDDLFVKLLEPYAKNRKQKQIIIPIISAVLSFLIIDGISHKVNRSEKGLI